MSHDSTKMVWDIPDALKLIPTERHATQFVRLLDLENIGVKFYGIRRTTVDADGDSVKYTPNEVRAIVANLRVALDKAVEDTNAFIELLEELLRRAKKPL